jgi:hypothetical protein
MAIPNCTEHAITFLWYRCAKRHFSFGRQKKSNQKKTLGCACFYVFVGLLFLVWLPNQTMPIFAVNEGVVL